VAAWIRASQASSRETRSAHNATKALRVTEAASRIKQLGIQSETASAIPPGITASNRRSSTFFKA
jgi:hypothetical protein